MRRGQHAPVVEDLAAQHMPADSPTVRPASTEEKVVPQALGIEIVYLKTGVMDMWRYCFGTSTKEKALHNHIVSNVVETPN